LDLPRCGLVPLVVAQLVFFIALLGPATIGIGVKLQSIVPDDQKMSALGIVAGFGALSALLGMAQNIGVLGGALPPVLGHGG
jgi:hypothetical protein